MIILNRTAAPALSFRTVSLLKVYLMGGIDGL